MSFSVKITIRSDTRYLALLRQLMSAIARIVGRKRLPKRAERACTLALIEAVDNAIFHAHHHRACLPIDVGIEVARGCVTMTVSDRGTGLDHLLIHAPKLVATKGRGLYIMDRLMDSVEGRQSLQGHELILKLNIY